MANRNSPARTGSSSSKLSTDEIQNKMHDIVTTGKDNDLGEMFDQVEAADEENFVNLDQEVFKFEKQGRHIFILTGTEEIKIGEDVVKVAKLMDRDKNKFINWDKLLVQGALKAKELPCFIAVEYSGDAKSSNGTYKKIQVQILKTTESGKLPF